MADIEKVGEALGSLLAQRLKSEAPVLDAGTLEAVVGQVIKESRFELTEVHENLMQSTERTLTSVIEQMPERSEPIDLTLVSAELRENREDAGRAIKALTSVIMSIVTAQKESTAEIIKRLDAVESALMASKVVKYDKQGRVTQVDAKKAK